MSLKKRIEDLERQIGNVSKNVSQLTSLLEDFFGVRRSRGTASIDPVLRIYQSLREYLALEKGRQAKLVELLTSAESTALVGVLELFLHNLPEDEQQLVTLLKDKTPNLIESLKESNLFEQLKLAKEELAKVLLSKEPVEASTTIVEEVTRGSKRQRSPTVDEEEDAEEEEQLQRVVTSQSGSKSKKSKKSKKESKGASELYSEELERLLRRHGVSFKRAELYDRDRRVKTLLMLPERELTGEDKELIMKHMFQ